MARANGKAVGAKPKKTKKEKVPGRGHNKTALKAAVKKYFSEYNKVLDDKEAANGSYMSEAKEILEKAANETGISRKLLRSALQEKRADNKRKLKERSLEPDEKKSLNDLRGCLDLPLFQAASKAEPEGEDDEGDNGREDDANQEDVRGATH